MSFIRAEYDRIGAAVEQSSANRDANTQVATWAVSQLLRGTFAVRDRVVFQGGQYGQDSLVIRGGLALELFANPECRSVLNGELAGPILATLSIVHADADPRERGFHTGTFTWGRGEWMAGTLAGISNAGTHHRPLYDAVAFDQAGQLVGRLEGRYDHHTLGPCVVFASYVLDLADPDDDVAAVTGILEGVVLADDVRGGLYG